MQVLRYLDVQGFATMSTVRYADMKKLYFLFAVLAILATFLLFASVNACADYEEEWNLISKYSPNDVATAAVMGWFYRESKFDSRAASGANEKESAKFVEVIDAGLKYGLSRDKFIKDVSEKYGGFGLGQWCAECYVGELYDFAQEWGTSIADEEMQIAFAFYYMEEKDPWNIWYHLCNEKDPYVMGFQIGQFIDGTQMPESVASYAKYFYDEYGEK